MHAMSALLDSLMGADRNALPEKRSTRQQAFSDPEVCKYYLVDFCPHDLFPNTRSDLGACTKLHKETLKEQYDSSPEKDRWAPEFEAQMITFLEQLILQAEQKIDKANRRIDAPLPDNALLSEEQQQQVDKMNEEISKLLKEAERAGERGDVEEAAVLTRNVQTLKKDAERAANTLYGSYMQREKSLRVCPICGAMQSVGDSMSRFESHVTGKQHIGFEKIRSCLEELKRRKEERDKSKLMASFGSSPNAKSGASPPGGSREFGNPDAGFQHRGGPRGGGKGDGDLSPTGHSRSAGNSRHHGNHYHSFNTNNNNNFGHGNAPQSGRQKRFREDDGGGSGSGHQNPEDTSSPTQPGSPPSVGRFHRGKWEGGGHSGPRNYEDRRGNSGQDTVDQQQTFRTSHAPQRNRNGRDAAGAANNNNGLSRQARSSSYSGDRNQTSDTEMPGNDQSHRRRPNYDNVARSSHGGRAGGGGTNSDRAFGRNGRQHGNNVGQASAGGGSRSGGGGRAGGRGSSGRYTNYYGEEQNSGSAQATSEPPEEGECGGEEFDHNRGRGGAKQSANSSSRPPKGEVNSVSNYGNSRRDERC